MLSKQELKKVKNINYVQFECLMIDHMFIYLFSEKYHGVIIMPEGLIESIPEMRALLNVIIITKK